MSSKQEMNEGRNHERTRIRLPSSSFLNLIHPPNSGRENSLLAWREATLICVPSMFDS